MRKLAIAALATILTKVADDVFGLTLTVNKPTRAPVAVAEVKHSFIIVDSSSKTTKELIKRVI
ncbi:MAG: hypothetical protein KDK50_04415 [Chlamydiia bacterium]|nr:hypothetical protein [Chlamydiia bacterium]